MLTLSIKQKGKVFTMSAIAAAPRNTDEIYAKVKHLIPEVEWHVHAGYIERIEQLKKLTNAVVLAHNYQTPEIYHGVADFTGDSLALAQQAAQVDNPVIVLCGVHFMAETAKIVNPGRTVLIPDLNAGCSLSDSCPAERLAAYKAAHPEVYTVAYINCSAGGK